MRRFALVKSDRFSDGRDSLAVPQKVGLHLLFNHNIQLQTMGDVVVQWLVRWTCDLKVESSSPGRCTHVVFIGKTLNFHSASLLINGNQQIALGTT